MTDTEQAAVAGEQEEREEEPRETEESVKAKRSNELKVVIILNDSRVMLGVQSPDCDPVYTTLKGTLADALKRVPKLVDEAKQKWSASPRNPNANLPTPAPTPARTPADPKTKTSQPSFF
ncbi:hypothetical protein ES705_08835 [subsurface metagenome]